MAKRVLTIGVGGTGKAVLTILKERLEETYGQVPDNVVLLSFDTDDLRDIDVFAGTRLNPEYDERGREPEFRQITSKPGVTMDTIFADLASGRTKSFMYWLEKEKLDRILSPAERDIRGGAQQRRPIGRVALFQRWDNPIYSSIVDAITRVYGEPEEERPVDEIKLEQSKRLVFIVGSVAGGTGSGFLIDVANLVQHAIQRNKTRWQSLDVSAIIVLPDAFSIYTTVMQDPTNLKPNSYAALRELDRFVRTHRASLPYMIRYDTSIESITWSTNQPLDHIYLVDTASPSGLGEFDLRGDPMRGVFPLIADFIMAHIDDSLGNAIATNRSNAGQHYNKEEGWQYSAFNIMSFIFPVDDVIESFSYRFLREMLTRQFLPIIDKKVEARVKQEAQKETERVFSENTVDGKVNPTVIQKALAVTRRMDPETPDVGWPELFNLISLSESGFAEDYQALEQWLSYLSASLVPTKEGDYKHETYAEGYVRLLNFSEDFMNECLGPQTDPEDEESREGGEWDKILGRYREALRQRFAEALDAALLNALNRRDPNTNILAPARLPFARIMVATLKERLVQFKSILEEHYRQLDIDTRIRQTNEELRNAIAWMHDTKDKKTFALPFMTPEARKAQEAYISLFQDKMELVLHRRIYHAVMDVLDALGAAERDKDGNLSVLDMAALELENWEATLQEVDKILARKEREHKRNRDEKRRVKVRRYLTDDEFEDSLYRRLFGPIASRVLGRVRGEMGMEWKRREEIEPLYYKLTTTWAEEAEGAERIAQSFFAGAKKLFQVVREEVSIADRVTEAFRKQYNRFVNLANQINEPFLRYNPADNGKPMFIERYVSFSLNGASDDARKFFDEVQKGLKDVGFTVDANAESTVACTIMMISRGVRLSAVDQFRACEPDYRAKLYQGQESLHLFTEEQVATDYENLIETLGEPDNRRRSLSPELVIAMGDKTKLRLFTLACAYGLVEPGTYFDEDTGRETTELFLRIGNRRMPLSESDVVRELDNSFERVSPEEQLARLYLNALQNFVLKVTTKVGVPAGMVANLVDELKRRGVTLGHIENPFTLPVKMVFDEIKRVGDSLGPSEDEEPDLRRREIENARRRIEKFLEPFLKNKVAAFKRSPAPRIRDMGTVMHLILRDEISTLKARMEVM